MSCERPAVPGRRRGPGDRFGAPRGGAGTPRGRAPAPRGRLVRPAALVAAAWVVAVPLAGCGKKGDPLPPLRPVPARTEGLSVQQRGLELILELPYPKVTAAGVALPSLDRVELYEVIRVAPPEDRLEAAEPDPAAVPPGEAAGEAPAAAGPPPAPAPLEPRQFAAAAQLRLAVTGPQLADAVAGDRIVLVVPLPEDFPPVAQARWFAVRTVVGEDDRSDLSNQASIVPRPPPEPVAGFAAEARQDGVLVTWEGDGPGVEGYDVYRREAANRAFGAPIGSVPTGTPSFLDTSARFGARYIYAVTAVARRAPVVESAIAAVHEVDYRDRFAPPAPQGLVALTEEGLVRLAWEGVRAADLAGYRVLRAAGPAAAPGDFEPLTTEPLQTPEYVDRAVTAGTAYTWRVVAVDASGNVSEAAEASATAR